MLWPRLVTALACSALVGACGSPGADGTDAGSASSTGSAAAESGTAVSGSSATVGATSAADTSSSEDGGETAVDDGSSGDTTCTPEVVFSDDFDRLRPPFLEEYPGLPASLFSKERWTQLQHVPPRAEHSIEWVVADGDGVISMLARGQPSPEASKIDLGRTVGLSFVEGDIVELSMDLYVDPLVGSGQLRTTTLLDLEDGDDIMLDGEFPTPGLRVSVDDEGRLMLDRGEIPGRETPGADAVLRLSNLRSEYVVPAGRWLKIEAIVKLGIGTPTSQVPIDETYDRARTSGWCELYVTESGGSRELVLRMAGATSFDADAAFEVIPNKAPDVTLRWPEVVDFDTFQAGLTNNRSTIDERISIDDVRVGRGC